MKKIVLCLLSTVSVVALIFGYHTSTSGSLATDARPISSSSSTGSASSRSGGSSSSSSSETSGSASSNEAATFTGTKASTQWGDVQVEITVTAREITAVAVPVYPNGNPRDDEINSSALPILIDETLDAQSAQIDMVSGATITSGGYVESLQSALDQAGL